MLTLFLGIIAVFLCIMVITNSALSSRKLVRVVARHHELTTEYANKIKELESSPLFDCEKGKHYWGLWEDVSAESERVVQKRRCGDCNKVEFSGVVAGESLKTSSPNTELLAEKVNASNLFLEKLQSKTTTYHTAVGTIPLYTDKVAELVEIFKDGASRWEALPMESQHTLPCTYCGGSFPYTEFATWGDVTYHHPSGMREHRPSDNPTSFVTKKMPKKKSKSVTETVDHIVSGDVFCEKCEGWFSDSEFASAGDSLFHYSGDLIIHNARRGEPRKAMPTRARWL